jgi:hypothetical protein
MLWIYSAVCQFLLRKEVLGAFGFEWVPEFGKSFLLRRIIDL